jgi:hypothetical protein
MPRHGRGPIRSLDEKGPVGTIGFGYQEAPQEDAEAQAQEDVEGYPLAAEN